MDAALSQESINAGKASDQCVPMVALASTVAFAAAGSLLGFSLFAPKRFRSVPGQLALGLLVVCAAAVTWQKREEEAEAARLLMHRMRDARDARWLRKNPIAYA
jgi:hypothetical protein